MAGKWVVAQVGGGRRLTYRDFTTRKTWVAGTAANHVTPTRIVAWILARVAHQTRGDVQRLRSSAAIGMPTSSPRAVRLAAQGCDD